MKSINHIAEKCREWADQYAHRNHLASNLTGLCAIASAKLFTELVTEGYHPALCLHSSYETAHCFVLLDDYIIDITATQFGDDTISILHEKEAIAAYYSDYLLFHSVKSFRSYQLKNGWPTIQVAL